MEITMNTLLAGVAVFISLIAIMDKWYGRTAKFSERIIALEGRQTDPKVLERLTALETKTGPFWRILEDHMADLLKQPIHLKMDALLDEFKVNRDCMALRDLEELKCEMLKVLEEAKMAIDKKAEGRTIGYIVMLGILESRIIAKQMEAIERKSCIEKDSKEFARHGSL